MFRVRNKWLVLGGAILAQLTIGAIYSWSIFNNALVEEKGWSQNQVYLTYVIAIFFFALITIVSGRLVENKGPRFTAIVGAILYGSGVILSSLATAPWMLYITYGVIAGCGVGFVYVCPLSTLIKWFPNKKGMITGAAVAAFGSGSLIFKNIIQSFVDNQGVSAAFLYVGIIFLIVTLLGAIFFDVPEGYAKKELVKTDADFTTEEMVKTSKFYKLTIMFMFGVTPGLLVIGLAKGIGTELVGLEAAAAAGAVTVIALFNAGGRLISGTLSDKFGPFPVLKVLNVATVIGLVMLSFLTLNVVTFYIALIFVAFSYGGNLALFPTITNQQFGSYKYASNYGLVYQGYGIAALLGYFIKLSSSAMEVTFIISAVAVLIAIGISFTVKDRSKA